MPAKLPIAYPTPKQIANALGVCGTSARAWLKEGMPNATIAAAEEWVKANKPHIGKRTTPEQEEIKVPPVVLKEDEDPQAVVHR